MPNFEELGLVWNSVLLAVSACVIGVAGWRLAKYADRLADLTKMGEAVSGALFLGASTSLPGIVTSVTAGYQGYAELAVSNAVGGIAAQTVFLVVADMSYRHSNLEHAAASVPNIMQGALLVALLSMPLMARAGPDFSWWGVHPATVLMVGFYIYGIKLVQQVRDQPMWLPERTVETRVDVPEEGLKKGSLARMWTGFLAAAAVVGAAGWVVALSGMALAELTGISETAVGGLLTAIATSLPELVTSISAVRQGALTLAVSGVIGGNAFDTLFMAGADVAYREGSIYHAATDKQSFMLALTILLSGILLMGLIRREKRGIVNIGFESFLILVLYVGMVVFLWTA